MLPVIIMMLAAGWLLSRKKGDVNFSIGSGTVNKNDWTGWVWPVPITDNRTPLISQEYKPGKHLGVDIMFRKRNNDPVGTSDNPINGFHYQTNGYIVPVGTVIVAPGPGKIWEAGFDERGHHIQIDHGLVGSFGGANTFMTHLQSFEKPWKKGDEVRTGDVLGVMGGDPDTAKDPRHTVHLHFELWSTKRPKGEWAIDPAPYLNYWRYENVASK